MVKLSQMYDTTSFPLDLFRTTRVTHLCLDLQTPLVPLISIDPSHGLSSFHVSLSLDF